MFILNGFEYPGKSSLPKHFVISELSHTYGINIHYNNKSRS